MEIKKPTRMYHVQTSPTTYTTKSPLLAGNDMVNVNIDTAKSTFEVVTVEGTVLTTGTGKHYNDLKLKAKAALRMLGVEFLDEIRPSRKRSSNDVPESSDESMAPFGTSVPVEDEEEESSVIDVSTLNSDDAPEDDDSLLPGEAV